MDKMTHAKVNLNNLLMGLSVALDKAFLPNKFNLPYNSQRLTYIALRLASYVNFEDKYLADIAAYGLLYRFSFSKEELETTPFLEQSHLDTSTIEIMKLSLLIEENLHIESNVVTNINDIKEIIVNSSFSETIKENFIDLSEDLVFCLDLTNNLQFPTLIYNFLQDFTQELEYTQLIKFSKVIYKAVNTKIDQGVGSDIGLMFMQMCEHYNLDNKDISRMIIGSYLYPLGKLYISKDILTKSKELSSKERLIVSSIPYHTANTLSLIYGFDDIATLCSYSNERLDGSGRPYEMDSSSLSLKDRLMAILIIYQALLEPRSYREAYTHEKAMIILREEAKNGKLDITIIEDVDRVFKG